MGAIVLFGCVSWVAFSLVIIAMRTSSFIDAALLIHMLVGIIGIVLVTRKLV